MPIKYNLTPYDILAYKIHKLSLKELKELHLTNSKDSENESDDIEIKLMAIIVASLTSSHSWQTYRCIEQHVDTFNSEIIKKEYEEAIAERWKHITPSDISELANLDINDSIFYRWSFFNVKKEDYKKYKQAWKRLKNEISNPSDNLSDTIKEDRN